MNPSERERLYARALFQIQGRQKDELRRTLYLIAFQAKDLNQMMDYSERSGIPYKSILEEWVLAIKKVAAEAIEGKKTDETIRLRVNR